jgi:tRNA threonylcarbamoyladenosine biosynthesis protein TsaE
LADPEELLFLGIEDLLQADAVLLVEWPEKGSGVLPAPDLSLEIHHGESERRLTLRAGSDKGVKIINNLQRVWDKV